MIVCLCHRVSDRDIAREVDLGCPDFDSLQDATRVGTACGACEDCARTTFHGCRRQTVSSAGCAGLAGCGALPELELPELARPELALA